MLAAPTRPGATPTRTDPTLARARAHHTCADLPRADLPRADLPRAASRAPPGSCPSGSCRPVRAPTTARSPDALAAYGHPAHSSLGCSSSPAWSGSTGRARLGVRAGDLGKIVCRFGQKSSPSRGAEGRRLGLPVEVEGCPLKI
ncbi:hypothetical protein GCM10010530_05510 [Kribbella aluminosa]